jgi:hypothetical protein
LLKNIPDFLSQPTGIAAIASVGIHGTIAFILPLMPVDSKPKQQEINPSKTVGVVELNQAEQNRLPQAGVPQVAIKPLALQPQIPPPPPNLSTQQQLLSPIPQSPTTQVILPPLPKSSTNLSIPSLPKSQPLQRLPLSNYPINPISSSLNPTAINPRPLTRFNDKVALGAPQPLPPSNISELQPAKTPAELAQTNLPIQSVNTTNRQANIATELPQTNLPVQSVNTNTRQSNIATGVSSSSRLPELQAAKVPPDLRSVPSVIPLGTTQNTTSPVIANGNTVSTAIQNRQLITPIGEPSQTRVSLANTNLIPSPQAGNASLSPQMQSTSNMGGAVVGKTPNFGDQFNQVKQQYPNIETKLPIFGTINAKSSQQSRLDGALIVDAEGKVETVTFMNNSVSSDLKASTREYFREYFQNNPVQKTGKPKYYPFSLSLKTDGSSEAVKQAPARLLQVAAPTNNTAGSSSAINQKQEALSKLRQRLIERRRGFSPVAQPSNEQPANVSQQVHTPQVNAQPLQLKQVSRISPQTSVKRQTNEGIRGNQPTPPSQIIPQASSQPKVSSNQPSTSIESGQKLLKRLRQLREQRQNNE